MSFLFKTKLRKKLLTYSYTHSDEHYYVRELASIISEDAGNLSRELRKLEEEGIYKSFTKGKEKFYSLNTAYPLFSQMKDIVSKTEGAEGSIKNIVSSYNGIKLAFIYGSYAKSTENKTSDIDLVVAGDFPVNKFTEEVRALENKLGREINFNSYTKKEFDKERKKKGGFLNLLLEGKIIILKGGIE